ncbi:MAG: LacI family DNA-binding transcriptional regulator [Alteromonadaceae bacterium]|nr:LacI family DNA-binding transcriptional regulator [Alteromonadaceae bacterium]
MVTINDVAKVAGVSIATVSRVIHNKGKVGDVCRARVKKIIEELAYRPNSNARALASKTSNTIGVVTPNLSMSFFASLASGVEKGARENGFKLLMANSLYETESELNAIESLRENNCKAIILHSEYSDENTLIKLAGEIPGLVLINRYVPEIANRCVWLDNLSGSQVAAKHLLNTGHKSFAVVTSIYQNRDPGCRVEGIKTTLGKNRIKLPLKNIEEATPNIEGGEQAVKALLAKGCKFDALLAYNDVMAIGAIHALFDAGLRVPEDVSVIGFDDLPIGIACRPRLTTMHYPVQEMALYATNLAIKLSESTEATATVSKQTHLFIADLVIRDSVKERTC